MLALAAVGGSRVLNWAQFIFIVCVVVVVVVVVVGGGGGGLVWFGLPIRPFRDCAVRSLYENCFAPMNNGGHST